jgi:hypothetical protein
MIVKDIGMFILTKAKTSTNLFQIQHSSAVHAKISSRTNSQTKLLRIYFHFQFIVSCGRWSDFIIFSSVK